MTPRRSPKPSGALARDPELLARLGEAARERALARYGLRQTADATAELYTELLERRTA